MSEAIRQVIEAVGDQMEGRLAPSEPEPGSLPRLRDLLDRRHASLVDRPSRGNHRIHTKSSKRSGKRLT